MFELKGKEKNMMADIEGGRATFRNLSSKQNKLDEETLKQQEILYTQVCLPSLSFLLMPTTFNSHTCVYTGLSAPAVAAKDEQTRRGKKRR